jgi:hypothetical protein
LIHRQLTPIGIPRNTWICRDKWGHVGMQRMQGNKRKYRRIPKNLGEYRIIKENKG